jgi:hypothetical protein
MGRKLTVLLCGIFLISAPASDGGNTEKPRQTRNATLRYWQAFSEMRDPPADKAAADALEKMSAGDVPWDNKFASVIDENEFAIEIMKRATKLPDCDWGLEYDLGPRAPIAYLPKARVLARLNTIYGMRAEANGETQKAIDTWLAGNRFAQHLTCGGSLIFSLVGAKMLVTNFHALIHLTRNGAVKVTDAQRKQILQSVQQIPETGFDWGDALCYEEQPLSMAMKELAGARSPAEYFRSLMGRAAPENFVAPTGADHAEFHRLMKGAEAALRLPPDAATAQVQSLQDQVKNLHPFYRETVPSFVRVNNARKDLAEARQQLIAAFVSH